MRFGTEIYTETVEKVDLLSGTPFKVVTEGEKVTVLARTVIIATGAVAKRLRFPGSDEYWNKGISACAVGI